VIQRGQRTRLTLEAGDAFGISRQRSRQDFDRDVASQFRVTGTVHLAHAARTDLRRDLVHAQACARDQCHGASLSID
jgi:hypothetical protein